MKLNEISSIIIRVEMNKSIVSFGDLASVISKEGGDIVAIDVIHSEKLFEIRDLTVHVPNIDCVDEISKIIKLMQGIRLIHISDRTFLMHLGGKIQIQPRTPIQNRDDLSHVYTPGVAKVCLAIQQDEAKSFSLTIRRNTVAIVSDGTAVLGLGDIGPYAAMPVMEGKAMLFKQFANVDAFPLCIQTKDVEEIIRFVKAITPTFGGINLEDISSPRCFEIEQRLREELDIPVFHDDQHGTAIVLLAGLINALKIVNKSLQDIKVVVCGIGAAGVACTNILINAGVRNIIGVDIEGALHHDHVYNNQIWNDYASRTNPENKKGNLSEIISGADVFIGLSRPDVLQKEDVKRMAFNPIIFAMANPRPEIALEEVRGFARVFATGRSDYPNQLNNVLAFPGIFRGALDCRARTINEEMKLAAAYALASIVSEDELNEDYIIPSVFNEDVVRLVRNAVIRAAIQTKSARKIPRDFRDPVKG